MDKRVFTIETYGDCVEFHVNDRDRPTESNEEFNLNGPEELPSDLLQLSGGNDLNRPTRCAGYLRSATLSLVAGILAASAGVLLIHFTAIPFLLPVCIGVVSFIGSLLCYNLVMLAVTDFKIQRNRRAQVSLQEQIETKNRELRGLLETSDPQAPKNKTGAVSEQEAAQQQREHELRRELSCLHFQLSELETTGSGIAYEGCKERNRLQEVIASLRRECNEQADTIRHLRLTINNIMQYKTQQTANK